MTESSSSNDRLVLAILHQIGKAIDDIVLWNNGIDSAEDYRTSPEGMKNLAATSMLLEAIGEGIKRVDRCTQGRLLQNRPEVPWAEVMGLRNNTFLLWWTLVHRNAMPQRKCFDMQFLTVLYKGVVFIDAIDGNADFQGVAAIELTVFRQLNRRC